MRTLDSLQRKARELSSQGSKRQSHCMESDEEYSYESDEISSNSVESEGDYRKYRNKLINGHQVQDHGKVSLKKLNIPDEIMIREPKL